MRHQWSLHITGVPAIITGGASGLGEAAARILAAAGAKVSILDLQQDKAEKVAAEIGGLAISCDVTSAESVESAFAHARKAHGHCGIALNCAGIGTPAKILGRDGPMSMDFFNKVIQVNLSGSFNIMRMAADDMQHREPNEDGERGVIISTASIAAFDGQIGQAAYSASKDANVSLTSARSTG